MKPYLIPVDGSPPVGRTRNAWWRFVERHLPIGIIYLMVLTLVAVVLAPHVLVTVPSGYVGVLWKRFGGGTVLDPRQLRNEGLRFIWPWNQLFLYDLRLQSTTQTYNAISKDGISLTASINIRFRLKRESVPQLHQTIGPNYVEALVGPEIGNRMREVIAEYTAEDVYSTKRDEIQEKIRKRAEAMLGEKMMEHSETEDYAPYRIPLYAMLNLIDTLILGIELPTAVVTAINRKIEQYYISEEYKFRVAREIRESERKKIEAEGIREFQQIVSQGISDSYLRWRGIEATVQLAQSTNSKIVIVGSGKDGLPIILGNVDTPQTASASPTGNGETGSKEKDKTASPAASGDKMPDETSSRGSGKGAAVEAPQASSSSLPLSLSDIEAMIGKLINKVRPTAADPSPTPNDAQKRAAEQQPH